MKTVERTQIIINSALRFLPALVILMLLTIGCTREQIEGNYNLVMEERISQPFIEVVSKGNFRVTIIPDDVTLVEVRAESNVMPYVETWSDGRTLTVEFRDGYNIHEHYPIEVFLHTPDLASIRLSGSGRVESGLFVTQSAVISLSGSGNIDCAFETENLEAMVSGSGDLQVSGTALTSSLRISGSGNIHALELFQADCSAEISGSGNIRASVSHTLDARISGSGCVYYHGNPDISTHISGSGKVIRY